MLGILYPFTTDPVLLTVVGFAMVTMVYIMVAVGFALYVPELFPTEIRMRGVGFSNTAGRLMTILTPQLIPVLVAGFGVLGVVTMEGALLLLMALVVGFTGVETKEKSLEALAPGAHLAPPRQRADTGAPPGLEPDRSSRYPRACTLLIPPPRAAWGRAGWGRGLRRARCRPESQKKNSPQRHGGQGEENLRAPRAIDLLLVLCVSVVKSKSRAARAVRRRLRDPHPAPPPCCARGRDEKCARPR
ncbi:MAG: MFS transporter [Pseudomonadota bacterium]